METMTGTIIVKVTKADFFKKNIVRQNTFVKFEKSFQRGLLKIYICESGNPYSFSYMCEQGVNFSLHYEYPVCAENKSYLNSHHYSPPKMVNEK